MRVEAPSKYCTCCKANRSLLNFKWNEKRNRHNTTCIMCAIRKKNKAILDEEKKKEMFIATAQQTFDEFMVLLSK